ncbi:MAG: hypothetical protein F4Z28_05250 [Gammaproteobacteria bacterium]|nr:hypothetical protein [Gammaproteobacteria bacterium]
MSRSHDALVTVIHGTPRSGVFTVTGGGAGLLSRLLGVAGASGTVLEANVPYSSQSLRDWLGTEPGQACSDETARAMAMRALARSLELGGDFGFAITASLATTRPKRGAHRAHMAFQDISSTRTWRVAFDKETRSREKEERLVEAAAIQALAHALDLGEAPAMPGTHTADDGRFAGLMLGRVTHIAAERFGAILPGAFNPLHAGHRAMRNDAEQRLGLRVGYELSIANVDKPMLDYQELYARLAQFEEGEVVVTKAPTFVDKARALGGVVFVVGVDTLKRIAETRYYGTEAERDAAIAELSAIGCRFLVYGREHGGSFKALEDLPLPTALHSMCTGVPEVQFRRDVSSTAIRRRRGSTGTRR